MAKVTSLVSAATALARRTPRTRELKLAPAMHELARARLTPGLHRYSDVFPTHARGCWVFTEDGRQLLDMGSGIGVTSTGHCHPHVVAAIQDQAATFIHAQQNLYSGTASLMRLLEAVAPALPRHMAAHGKLFFANSGAEAVDQAVKVARAASGRRNIIAFEGAFHGRTLGAMSLTSSKAVQNQGMGPLMPGVYHAPYPYCLHCKARPAAAAAAAPPAAVAAGAASSVVAATHTAAGSETITGASSASRACGGCGSAEGCCNMPLDGLEALLAQRCAPSDTAAVLVEAIQGEGGYVVPPRGFLPALRRICDKHGMLLIIDEVQSGTGRTGKWWAYQWHEEEEGGDEESSAAADGGSHHHQQQLTAEQNQDSVDNRVAPDMIIAAKGLASGFPFSALISRPELLTAMAPGSLGGTYGGNPMACAAAAATLEVIQQEGLLANATARGAQLAAGLRHLAEKHAPHVIDVRGRGLMQAIELAADAGNALYRGTVAKALCDVALARHDMLLLTTGCRQAVRLLPPLNVSAQEVDTALQRLDGALKDVLY